MIHDIAYYKRIQNAHQSTSAKQTLLREVQQNIEQGFMTSVHWDRVEINERPQVVQITKTKEVGIKDIVSKPNEVLRLGERVTWRNAYWLILKLDVDNQITYLGKLYQCNTALKWQLEDGSIYTEYGVSEDATKYGTGVDDTSYLQIGEFSLKVKVPMNENTLKIKRDKRFLLGRYGEGYQPSAYVVTRINQVTNTYEKEEDTSIMDGYIELTMGEDQFKEETDRSDLGIADYVDDITNATPPIGSINPNESGWF